MEMNVRSPLCSHALNSNHADPDGAWMAFGGSCSINMALLTELFQSLIPPETVFGRFFLGANRAVLLETHRGSQPLQSEPRNAKSAPESAICGVLPNRPAPTGSVVWRVPISNPRSAPRRVGRTNLRPDALPALPLPWPTMLSAAIAPNRC